MLGVFSAPRRELLGRAGIGERAARFEVRQHHGLVGAEDLGRLRHEVDAEEEDHVLVLGLLRLLGQHEGVPKDVGDVLQVRLLVVVRQDDRVALVLEPLDLLEEVEGRVDRALGTAEAAHRALRMRIRAEHSIE